MRRAGITLIVLALAGAAPAAHGQGPPNLPWPQVLPPSGTPTGVQPGPMPGCRKPRLSCIDRVIRRLKARRDRLGCDHRAVFANTYLLLTKEIRATVKRNPRFFDDKAYLYYEDVLFAEYYFPLFRRGAQVPEAWRIAFDVAASGDHTAGHDMLLGINAHVQRDMPYVLATLGLRKPDGTSRKPDHDRGNEILAAAYEKIVRDTERRYDPALATSNPAGTPHDDVAGLELVKGWRENVWRNAERLLNARTEQERQMVIESIERNAADSARSIASSPTEPGYRQQRDSYCNSRP